MKRYRPMAEAPKDGTPIIAVCGGVEMPVIWDDPAPDVPGLAGWWYFDEDEGPETPVKQCPTEWRAMF